MRVAFISQEGDLGIYRHIKGLLRELSKHSIETKEFFINESNIKSVVDEFVSFQPMFSLDINGTGILISEQEGKKSILSDALGFVHISLFFDDPIFYAPSLYSIKDANNFIYFLTDIKYSQSLSYMGFNRGVLYMAPFVDGSMMPEVSQKDIPFVFLGPVADPELILKEIEPQIPKEFLPFAYELSEYLFRNPEALILSAKDYVLSLFHIDFQEQYSNWAKENSLEEIGLLAKIATLATAKKRWYILSFLEGMELKVLGPYKGELKEGHEHIDIKNWQDALEVLSRTRLCMISFPHAVPTGIGFTPLEVAYLGCAPMLDFRMTLPGFFTPGEDVITYLPLDRADIEEKLVFYLENPQEAEKIGQNARKTVEKNFTPSDRAEFMARVMNDIFSQAQKA
ncbi:MAG: glycosyltransferase [Aquificaceae bacterium]